MSKRVISQKAFDDVVEENMLEFEMDVEEAIDDAVKQFEAQDVDLSNIIQNMVQVKLDKSTSGNAEHPVVNAIKTLDLAITGDSLDVESLIPALETLQEQCAIDLAHRVLAGQHGAMEKLFGIFQKSLTLKLDNVFDATLMALMRLLDGQPDIISFEQLSEIVELLRGYDINLKKEWLTDLRLAKIIHILQLVCIKHEANRQELVRLGIIPIAVSFLGSESEEATNAKIPDRIMVRNVCALLQTLTLDDDMRVPFGKAHDHAKAIVAETPSLYILLRVLKAFKESEDHEVVADAFRTLSSLSVRNEFCQTLLDCGGVALILESLSNHDKNQAIVRTSLLLLGTLAGNDNVKVEVGRCGGIALVLETMQRFVATPTIAQNGCAAIAMICLRQPDNSQLAVDAGCPALLEQILKVHITNVNVVRQVCLAVRNIVGRRIDLQPAFLTDFAYEALLNEHGMKLCPDEAKAALRDLGCHVTFIEAWTGKHGCLVKP